MTVNACLPTPGRRTSVWLSGWRQEPQDSRAGLSSRAAEGSSRLDVKPPRYVDYAGHEIDQHRLPIGILCVSEGVLSYDASWFCSAPHQNAMSDAYHDQKDGENDDVESTSLHSLYSCRLVVGEHHDHTLPSSAGSASLPPTIPSPSHEVGCSLGSERDPIRP